MELSKVYDVVAEVEKFCFVKVKNLSAGVFPMYAIYYPYVLIASTTLTHASNELAVSDLT